MLKYNNTHIFTGYLKQLLSSVNIPTCKIYTHEYANHLKRTGIEDPRVLKSFKGLCELRPLTQVNYLKNNEVYNYFWEAASNKSYWLKSTNKAYKSTSRTSGLTKTLASPGINYDTKTHEYLGDYLRFIRDYYNVNLMSLYNCFVDKIYNNINFTISQIKANFNSQDTNYRIYAIPVKLFANYTIAIDCAQSIEMFCGFYGTNLELTDKSNKLARQTYQKVNGMLFNQPFLYTKLDIANWQEESDFIITDDGTKVLRNDRYTRWDLVNKEKDLKLFIKIPAVCRSTITILEGDYRAYNNSKYSPTATNAVNEDEESKRLVYSTNRSVLNFNKKDTDLNEYDFNPISRLQLLALNTGESYPFADRLIEYLSGSVVTPMDDIPDNIKRAQRVMNQNENYFKIDGLWENKMQNILYDYIMNSGPVEAVVDKDGKKILKDARFGYYRRLGHTNKSLLFDILGFVDKDMEKFYASWKKTPTGATVNNTIQNVDIYDGLYDI